MLVVTMKWCFASSYDTGGPRIKFSYNSKMAIFCYDVIYDVMKTKNSPGRQKNIFLPTLNGRGHHEMVFR